LERLAGYALAMTDEAHSICELPLYLSVRIKTAQSSRR